MVFAASGPWTPLVGDQRAVEEWPAENDDGAYEADDTSEAPHHSTARTKTDSDTSPPVSIGPAASDARALNIQIYTQYV